MAYVVMAFHALCVTTAAGTGQAPPNGAGDGTEGAHDPDTLAQARGDQKVWRLE